MACQRKSYGPGLPGVVQLVEENPAEGSEGEGTLPWDRLSSIRRLILHAQSGITPTFASLARQRNRSFWAAHSSP